MFEHELWLIEARVGLARSIRRLARWIDPAEGATKIRLCDECQGVIAQQIAELHDNHFDRDPRWRARR